MSEVARSAVSFILSVALGFVVAPAAVAAICGDADGNGTITDTDGVQSLRAAASLLSTCTIARCDLDGSGLITDVDGVNVLRKAASLPVVDSCPGGGGPLQRRVSEAYASALQLSVPSPAIFNDPLSMDCLGNEHLTTTLYLRTNALLSTLAFLYFSRDGLAVTRQSISSAVTPAGTFPVLALVLLYPETTSANGPDLWRAAQERINEDHTAFARTRGYGVPIVRFDNVNLFVDAREVAEPRTFAGVQAVAERHGVLIDNFVFVMSVNIDPALSEGGFAAENGFVYMGNFLQRTTSLSASDWDSIAAAVYHHEVAHHWGWPGTHDWTGSCGEVATGFEPFIVPPILFGWEDVDGDGVPEIFDDTPYGRPE